MVDFARIQNRIYYGYGKAAVRLGTDHIIYRSVDGIDPIQTANLIGIQKISVDANLKYTSVRKYGDNLWQFLPEDGLGLTTFSLQNYDYMLSPTSTYFIVDILPDDRLSPPVCMECNGTITIRSPKNALTPGINDYQEYKTGEGILRIQNVPCSILQYGYGSKEMSVKLPTSAKLPQYQIIIPEFDGVPIKTGDIVTDNSGRRMIISSAELNKKGLGFRLLAQELGA